MKVAKDTFLIRVESDRNSHTGIDGINGKKISIDVDYNKYKHTTQIGEIFACPIKITSQYIYDLQLKEGDIVLFHHFVCQPDHRVNIGENIYRAEYFHLYAKMHFYIGAKPVSGWKIAHKIFPLEDIIFVEPILEDEDNLFAGKIRIKTHRENLKQTGIVFALSNMAREAGICEGDKVFFSANADYQMKVVDKELYRMRIRNIAAIERDGKIVCLHAKILVKEIGPENSSGIFTDVKKNQQTKGVVESVGKNISGIEVGQEISYFNSSLGSIEYKGNTYAFLELRNINYIISDGANNIND